MGREDGRATLCRITKSQIGLKQLSMHTHVTKYFIITLSKMTMSDTSYN